MRARGASCERSAGRLSTFRWGTGGGECRSGALGVVTETLSGSLTGLGQQYRHEATTRASLPSSFSRRDHQSCCLVVPCVQLKPARRRSAPGRVLSSPMRQCGGGGARNLAGTLPTACAIDGHGLEKIGTWAGVHLDPGCAALSLSRHPSESAPPEPRLWVATCRA
jgi:hypothetical protein